jgi:hypothetical protein
MSNMGHVVSWNVIILFGVRVRPRLSTIVWEEYITLCGADQYGLNYSVTRSYMLIHTTKSRFR